MLRILRDVVIKFPFPDIGVQKVIADIYTAYTTRKAINEELKSSVMTICPILIKGSVEEARRA